MKELGRFLRSTVLSLLMVNTQIIPFGWTDPFQSPYDSEQKPMLQHSAPTDIHDMPTQFSAQKSLNSLPQDSMAFLSDRGGLSPVSGQAGSSKVIADIRDTSLDSETDRAMAEQIRNYYGDSFRNKNIISSQRTSESSDWLVTVYFETPFEGRSKAEFKFTSSLVNYEIDDYDTSGRLVRKTHFYSKQNQETGEVFPAVRMDLLTTQAPEPAREQDFAVGIIDLKFQEEKTHENLRVYRESTDAVLAYYENKNDLVRATLSSRRENNGDILITVSPGTGTGSDEPTLEFRVRLENGVSTIHEIKKFSNEAGDKGRLIERMLFEHDQVQVFLPTRNGDQIPIALDLAEVPTQASMRPISTAVQGVSTYFQDAFGIGAVPEGASVQAASKTGNRFDFYLNFSPPLDGNEAAYQFSLTLAEDDAISEIDVRVFEDITGEVIRTVHYVPGEIEVLGQNAQGVLAQVFRFRYEGPLTRGDIAQLAILHKEITDYYGGATVEDNNIKIWKDQSYWRLQATPPSGLNLDRVHHQEFRFEGTLDAQRGNRLWTVSDYAADGSLIAEASRSGDFIRRTYGSASGAGTDILEVLIPRGSFTNWNLKFIGTLDNVRAFLGQTELLSPQLEFEQSGQAWSFKVRLDAIGNSFWPANLHLGFDAGYDPPELKIVEYRDLAGRLNRSYKFDENRLRIRLPEDAYHDKTVLNAPLPEMPVTLEELKMLAPVRVIDRLIEFYGHNNPTYLPDHQQIYGIEESPGVWRITLMNRLDGGHDGIGRYHQRHFFFDTRQTSETLMRVEDYDTDNALITRISVEQKAGSWGQVQYTIGISLPDADGHVQSVFNSKVDLSGRDAMTIAVLQAHLTGVEKAYQFFGRRLPDGGMMSAPYDSYGRRLTSVTLKVPSADDQLYTARTLYLEPSDKGVQIIKIRDQVGVSGMYKNEREFEFYTLTGNSWFYRDLNSGEQILITLNETVSEDLLTSLIYSIKPVFKFFDSISLAQKSITAERKGSIWNFQINYGNAREDLIYQYIFDVRVDGEASRFTKITAYGRRQGEKGPYPRYPVGTFEVLDENRVIYQPSKEFVLVPYKLEFDNSLRLSPAGLLEGIRMAETVSVFYGKAIQEVVPVVRLDPLHAGQMEVSTTFGTGIAAGTVRRQRLNFTQTGGDWQLTHLSEMDADNRVFGVMNFLDGQLQLSVIDDAGLAHEVPVSGFSVVGPNAALLTGVTVAAREVMRFYEWEFPGVRLLSNWNEHDLTAPFERDFMVSFAPGSTDSVMIAKTETQTVSFYYAFDKKRGALASYSESHAPPLHYAQITFEPGNLHVLRGTVLQGTQENVAFDLQPTARNIREALLGPSETRQLIEEYVLAVDRKIFVTEVTLDGGQTFFEVKVVTGNDSTTPEEETIFHLDNFSRIPGYDSSFSKSYGFTGGVLKMNDAAGIFEANGETFNFSRLEYKYSYLAQYNQTTIEMSGPVLSTRFPALKKTDKFDFVGTAGHLRLTSTVLSNTVMIRSSWWGAYPSKVTVQKTDSTYDNDGNLTFETTTTYGNTYQTTFKRNAATNRYDITVQRKEGWGRLTTVASSLNLSQDAFNSGSNKENSSGVMLSVRATTPSSSRWRFDYRTRRWYQDIIPGYDMTFGLF